MKTAIQKSRISDNQAFEVKHLTAPHFDPTFHFHSEYQLFMVMKGTGTRFIGDSVTSFKPGDLVFTGPNLPHLWQSDRDYYMGDETLQTEGLVIYFGDDFLNHDFLNKNEAYLIKQLFHKAQRGLSIQKPTADYVMPLMLELLAAEDFDRIITIFRVLNLLAKSRDYELLASEGYSNFMKESDSDRMSRIHTFVMQNFRDKVSLTAAAAIANMSPTSFSRYFKVHANKTFSDFLAEIRIGHSCKLLVEKKISVSDVCFESGFNTLSNFNKQFKAITNFTPLEYRKKFTKN